MAAGRPLSHHPAPAGRPVAAGARRHRSRGAAIAEAAFAIPIFLSMLLGFVDLGFAVFQTSQASSAAADGARTGIVDHRDADESGSTNRLAIETSVKARLVGQKIDTIAVVCLTPEEATVACDDADPETDRIRVTVTWRFRPISPVGNLLPVQDISGSATMGIIRQPSAAPTTPTTLPPSP
jgi:Flp pilus assembly protein TadG